MTLNSITPHKFVFLESPKGLWFSRLVTAARRACRREAEARALFFDMACSPDIPREECQMQAAHRDHLAARYDALLDVVTLNTQFSRNHVHYLIATAPNTIELTQSYFALQETL